MARLAADPFPLEFDPATTVLIVIDMQRDFIEEGGFGAALGNDVRPLQAIVPVTARLIAAARRAGLPVIHTRECHAPDLSDCPPAKRARGAPRLRIGDTGPMGRILIAGEPGAAIVPELAPLDGEIVIDKPGKGAFYATDLGRHLAELGAQTLIFAGVTTEVCVQTTMREANAFEPFRPGVEIHWIRRGDPAVALLAYAPGARVPRHEHTGLETILVLDGTQSDDAGSYPAGSLVLNPEGSVHSVWSDEGCVVLIEWERPVSFLDDPA